jgi:hypothetical protein
MIIMMIMIIMMMIIHFTFMFNVTVTGPDWHCQWQELQVEASSLSSDTVTVTGGPTGSQWCRQIRHDSLLGCQWR